MIKFDSEDELQLSKELKFPTMTVSARPVFEEDDKFYQQICLDECLYEL